MGADSPDYAVISFEPLKREHIGRLCQWREQPHVREYYSPLPISREAALEKYLPRLDPASPTKAFVIRTTIPIGYIQAYRLCDWPEYAAIVGEIDGISVDLFVGEESYVGCGWGRRTLIKFLTEVAFPIFPDQRVCWMSHDLGNERARRAARAAGFQPVRTILEDGKSKELLVLTRLQATITAQKFKNEGDAPISPS